MYHTIPPPSDTRSITLGIADRVGPDLLKNQIHAPVAQLDRVAVSEAVGRAFKSRRVHHIYQ